jgi:hypothetical protein
LLKISVKLPRQSFQPCVRLGLGGLTIKVLPYFSDVLKIKLAISAAWSVFKLRAMGETSCFVSGSKQPLRLYITASMGSTW